jgi:hydroxymethylglutaryl-CoA reductase (NADPH)
MVTLFLMHVTFIMHFQNMRKLGSRFSLGFAVLLNGTFALVISLVFARIFGFGLSIVQLCESLPLLVVTIGFEKPYLLAKAIVESDGKTSREKVEMGVTAVGRSLIIDYILETTILSLGCVFGAFIK